MQARINGVRVIPTEDEEQIIVIRWAEMQAGLYPELRLLHHIPNGGKRSKREAAIFRAMGVRAGIPDLFLPCARGGYHGLYIEMKALDGKLSAAQCETIDMLRRQGYRCEVCRGADAAIAVLRQYCEEVGRCEKKDTEITR